MHPWQTPNQGASHWSNVKALAANFFISETQPLEQQEESGQKVMHTGRFLRRRGTSTRSQAGWAFNLETSFDRLVWRQPSMKLAFSTSIRFICRVIALRARLHDWQTA
jgi:hypothetical protein